MRRRGGSHTSTRRCGLFWDRLLGAALCSLAFACSNGGSSQSAAFTGCEDSCRYALSCVFMLSDEELGTTCSDACREVVPQLDDECREAYGAFGQCSAGASCEEFDDGQCADELEAANAACEDQAMGSSVALEPSADDETDTSNASNEGDSPASCADYAFEVTGQDCDGTCEVVECECDPFPSSFSACTPDGCIVAADCDAVCASGLADLFDCTDSYTLPDGTLVSDDSNNLSSSPDSSGDSTTVISASPDSDPSGDTVPNAPVIIVDGDSPAPSSGECVPETCATQGASCGTVDDGCGGELQCGFCSPPETCGGGGDDKQCGCTPIECSDVGAECGLVDDGCGGSLDCGGCGEMQWCGGGGEDNQCGCAPSGMSEGFAQMGASVEGIGTEPWTDVEMISVIDDGEGLSTRAGNANVNLTNGQETHWLVGSDFGLDIPDNASVAGIEVDVWRRGYSLGNVADNAVRLVQGGSILTHDAALADDWGTASIAASYGGEADLWETEWTPADLRDPSFGVALSARYTTTAGNSWALVDAISVRVHYTAVCE